VANVTFFKQRVARGLDVSASLYNLFGTRYSDPASEEFRQDSIAQDGRTARVWLTLTFPRTN
jgi:iron complex outermembrane receptor protein